MMGAHSLHGSTFAAGYVGTACADEYRLPVPSAQVKSAILLAGLSAPGETTVVEPEATRDHTERMLCHFGAMVRTETAEDGAGRITLVGQPELAAADIVVPRDISSAAFPMVAGLIPTGGISCLVSVSIRTAVALVTLGRWVRRSKRRIREMSRVSRCGLADHLRPLWA